MYKKGLHTYVHAIYKLVAVNCIISFPEIYTLSGMMSMKLVLVCCITI